jgi:hypothetical protein
MEGFSDFVMHAGYLAAEHLASDGQRTPEKTSSLWPRLLDDSWKELLASLGEIPSASVETARQELDAFAFGSIDVLDRWLKHIGFAIHDLEGGSIYFRVLRQDF